MTGAALDWSTLTVTAAFVLGVVVGGAAVLRVTRYVMGWLRRDDDARRRAPD